MTEAYRLEPVNLPTAATEDNITSMFIMAFSNVQTAAIAMLLSIAAASAGAQDSTHVTATPDSLASWYRDPRTAQTLGSFIPGAGHMYAGEKLRGLGLGGAAVIGIASGIAAWVFGAIDAPRSAQRTNARARRRVSVAPFVRDDLVRRPALGTTVTVGW